MRFISFFLMCILLLQPSVSQSSCFANRYIFDIGSGGIYSIAYEVDTCHNKVHKTIDKQYYNLPLQECISNSIDKKTIPEACINRGKLAFSSLQKALGVDCKKQTCVAVATAWARNAKNSKELINEVRKQGINISILSQYDEGRISFHSLMEENNISFEEEKNTLVFDIGGGSFQLNTLNDKGVVHVYKGPYGMFNFKPLVINKFSDNKTDILPIKHLKQIKDFALEEVSTQLKKDKFLMNKFATKQLNVLGAGSFMGIAIKTQLGFGNSVSIEDIEGAIDTLIGKTVPEIQAVYPNMPKEYASNAQFSLLIIYAVMKEGGIKRINIPTDGGISKYLALNDVTASS